MFEPCGIWSIWEQALSIWEAHILNKILTCSKESKVSVKARKGFEHFEKVNHIDEKTIPCGSRPVRTECVLLGERAS